jgi:peptide/nickel transport system ATP-binding protein
MPRMDRERQTRLVPIPGMPPSLIRVPPGCPFHPRCRYTALTGGRCQTEVPVLREAMTPGHAAACHLTVAQKTREWAALSADKVPEDAGEPDSREPVPQGGVET